MPRVKRGLSGLSLVVGVNKPAGVSSHDVVNRCRSIFGERRVGHTGTLDPKMCIRDSYCGVHADLDEA